MDFRNESVVRDVANRLGIPYDTVKEVYRLYMKCMRERIDSVDFFKRRSFDEFMDLKPNFTILKFGSLRVKYGRCIKMNKIKIWKIAHGKMSLQDYL